MRVFASHHFAMQKLFDTRALIGLALVVVAIVVGLLFTVVNTRRMRDDAAWVVHTHQVVGELQELLSTLKDAETGQRGYLITLEGRFLEPYVTALATLDARYRAVSQLTFDNPTRQDQLGRLRKKLDAGIALLAENIEQRRTGGLEAARRQLVEGRGKALMDEIRADVASMIAEEQGLVAQRTARLDDQFQTAVIAGIGVAAFGLAMVIVFVVLLRQSATVRKAALEAVHRESEQLRITLASIGDGVITTDAAGAVAMLNPAAEHLTGWPQADAAGESLDRVFHIVNETTREAVENPALRSLREGTVVGLANHTVLISRTGYERAIADSAAPIRDLAGNLLGSILVFRDVSEERAIERALAESEARKSAILEFALDAIISCDHDGRVIEFNPAAEAMFGFAKHDVVGRELGELIVPPGLRNRHRAGMRRYLETGNPTILNRRLEMTALRKDGSEFPVELAITPIHGEGSPMFTAHVRDITERREADRQLQERVRLLALTADVSRALTRGDTVHDMLQGCAEAVLKHLEGALARIWIFNEAEQMLQLVGSAADAAPRSLSQERVPIGREKIGIIAAQRRPLLSNSIVGDPLVPDQDWVRAENLISFAGYPLLVGERLVGVMSMFARHVLEPHTLDVMASVAGDIALAVDRARAIREVEESRRLLQVTLAGIGDAVLTTDSQGRVTFLNPIAEQLTGWTNAEAAGRSTDEIFRIVNEATNQAVESPVEKVLREGLIVGLANHTVLIAKDGIRRPIDDSGAPIRNENGELLGSVLVFRDVSERRNSDRRLRDVTARLNAALEAGAIGTWVWDIANDRTYADDNLARIFHVGATDAEGGPQRIYLESVHPFDREVVGEQLRRSLERGERFECEFRIPQPNGEIRWYVARGTIETDDADRPIRMPGVVVDITDRKRAEQDIFDLTEASERERRLYDTILSAVPDLVYVFDLRHRFTYANKALLDMWGKTWNESIGKTCLELGYEPWHAKMHDEEIDTVAATKAPIRSEVPFTGTHGRRIYDYIFFPVFAADGSVEAVAGTTRDVTERKQMEEHLRTVAAELSEANRRKTEFLATLAHELRNPMAPIRTGLELLKVCKGDPSVTDETLGMMERQTLQMVRLIDDLLDVSRITQGKLQLRKTRVDLAEVIQSSVEAVRATAEEAGHRLEVELPAQPLKFDADRNRLAQIISNLLNNAVKYTHSGGLIRLQCRADDGQIIISVTDNGIGIPPAMQSRIFEMFTQIDRPLEQGYTGLGIGLTLVKQLVEMHDGVVEVASEGDGRGSTFTVRLPLIAETTTVAGDVDVTEIVAEARGHRVLVVDDNLAAASTLSTVLRFFGNEVRTAHDGLEAVRLAAEFLPELILMDLGMPKLSGYEAAQRIRQQPWGRGIVLAALTGWGQAEDRRRTQEAGFDIHLTKPAEPRELLRLLAGLKREPK